MKELKGSVRSEVDVAVNHVAWYAVDDAVEGAVDGAVHGAVWGAVRDAVKELQWTT